MQYTDDGTLRKHFVRLNAQLLDAIKLGGKLFESSLKTENVAMSLEDSLREYCEILIEYLNVSRIRILMKMTHIEAEVEGKRKYIAKKKKKKKKTSNRALIFIISF